MPLQLAEVMRRNRSQLDARARNLIRHCVSPLTGLIRTLRMNNYDASNPSLVTVLPELPEIHRRAGVSRPDYHLGGFGVTLEEGVYRAIGESLERASHFQFHLYQKHLLKFCSQDQLRESGVEFLPITQYGHFADSQYRQLGCPVKKISPSTEISWLPTKDLNSGKEVYIPAQELLAGFPCQREPRAFVGITTGTAAHVDYPQALQGALLELLQVDATTGHWYSESTARRIPVSQEETPRFWRLLHLYSEYFNRSRWRYEYYWIQQPENIAVYTVACVIRSDNVFPALMIGHGVSTDIERAMYRALYEAVPISLVVQIQVLRQLYDDPNSITGKLASERKTDGTIREIFQRMRIEDTTDLESAVAYYAIPENSRALFPSRFDPDAILRPSEIYERIPPKWKDGAAQDVVFDMLHETARHHRIYWMDLTSSDMDSVGIKVVRLYSPDLMSLPLPSYPEAAHPRFDAYGGFRSARPHPYP